MNRVDSKPADKTAVNPRKYTLWLGLILAANLIVTIAYSAVNPLFEAPDEQLHYYTAQLIVDTGQLPYLPPDADYDEWISQEAAQPPLYYILGAALIAPIDSSNAREEIWPNKFSAIGDAGALSNRNRFVHTSSEEWPWQGYALAVHILRGFSVLLGLGTLVCIYGSGRLLWPKDPFRAILATGLIAFLPQFNFLFASVSNDTLIIFLSALSIWQLIRMWQSNVTRGRLLLLGITIGLATMSKNAGLILLVYASVFLILLNLRDMTSDSRVEGNAQSRQAGGVKRLGEIVVFFLLPAILMASWVLMRNYTLYGDLTATNQFLRFSSGDRDYTILQVLSESNGLWLSLIAVFGWFNIRPPNWVYWFWNGMIVAALAGAAWHWFRRRKNRVEDVGAGNQQNPLKIRIIQFLHKSWTLSVLLAGWVIIVYASLFLFMLRTEAAQGRLLFPALVPLALGLAYGWTANRAMHRLSVTLTPAALLITLFCLFFVIRPAYAIPPTMAVLPDDVQVLDVNFGQDVSLVGSKMKTVQALAGDAVWMTLYWQAVPIPSQAVEFVLSVFGRDYEEIGKVHSYHGRGLYPANLWPTGKIVADRFAVQINDEVKTPVLAQIESGLAGEGFSVVVGEVKIVPDKWPELVNNEIADLGNIITLTSVVVDPAIALVGESVELNVQWHVMKDPGRDFTTLLHLGRPDKPPIVVGDRPPLAGSYPTRAWSAGEVINDSYHLLLPKDLPPGRYPLWLGMYDTETIERLPVFVNGEPQTNNVILAGWVEIE